jgi:hypothetical protein
MGRHNRRSLRYPGFPVGIGEVGEVHAPFFTEGRTRGGVQCSEAGNPGPVPRHAPRHAGAGGAGGTTKGRVVIPMRAVAGLELLFISLGGLKNLRVNRGGPCPN